MSDGSFTQRAKRAVSGAVRMSPGRDAKRPRPRQNGNGGPTVAGAPPFPPREDHAALVDLGRRRDELNARVAELQWDLGGLVYEMAIRDSIRVDVLVRRAAELQNADAELSEVERILRLEQTSTAGLCASCGSPHSSGAAYCWQCGQPLLREVHSDTIGG